MQSRRWGRRLTLFLVTALAATGAADARAAPKKVYFMNSGGTTETLLEKDGWAARFQKETGYQLVMVLKGASEEVIGTAIAEKNHPQIDVIESDYPAWVRGIPLGLYAPLDAKAIPNVSELYDIGQQKHDGTLYGVSPYVYVCGILYQKDIFAKNGWAPPTRWEDLFDPKYRGRLVIPTVASTYGLDTLIQFARMNGGSEHDIGPGFAALARLAPGIVGYPTSGAQVAQLMHSGSAYVAVYSVSQARSFQAAGIPAAYSVPVPTYVTPVVISMVKGGPNPAGAQAFINWYIGKNVVEFRAQEFGQTPLNKEVKVSGAFTLTPEAVSHITSFDYPYVAAHQGQWLQRFQLQIAPIPRAK